MKFKSLMKHGCNFFYKGMRGPHAHLSPGGVSHDVPVLVYNDPVFQRDMKLKRIEVILSAEDRSFLANPQAKVSVENRPKTTIQKFSPETERKMLRNMTAPRDKAGAMSYIREEMAATLGMIRSDEERRAYLQSSRVDLQKYPESETLIASLQKEFLKDEPRPKTEPTPAVQAAKAVVPAPPTEPVGTMESFIREKPAKWEPVEEEKAEPEPEPEQEPTPEEPAQASASSTVSLMREYATLGKKSSLAKLLSFALKAGIKASPSMTRREVFELIETWRNNNKE